MPVAEMLVATCSDSGVSAEARRVAAQRDGVHFNVRNTTSNRVVFRAANGGFAVEVVEEDVVRYIPPGSAEVSCGGPTNEDVGPAIDIEIVDENGYYVPGTIDCLGGPIAMADSSGSDPMPSPEDAAAAAFDGTAEGDRVRQAGYPEQSSAEWVLERDGRVVATATVTQAGREFIAYLSQFCA